MGRPGGGRKLYFVVMHPAPGSGDGSITSLGRPMGEDKSLGGHVFTGRLSGRLNYHPSLARARSHLAR